MSIYLLIKGITDDSQCNTTQETRVLTWYGSFRYHEYILRLPSGREITTFPNQADEQTNQRQQCLFSAGCKTRHCEQHKKCHQVKITAICPCRHLPTNQVCQSVAVVAAVWDESTVMPVIPQRRTGTYLSSIGAKVLHLCHQPALSTTQGTGCIQHCHGPTTRRATPPHRAPTTSRKNPQLMKCIDIHHSPPERKKQGRLTWVFALGRADSPR